MRGTVIALEVVWERMNKVFGVGKKLQLFLARDGKRGLDSYHLRTAQRPLSYTQKVRANQKQKAGQMLAFNPYTYFAVLRVRLEIVSSSLPKGTQ